MLQVQPPVLKRSAHKFRFDDRILEALKVTAAEQGVSFNAYVEGVLFSHSKVIGKIPAATPPLAETRGKSPGSRTGGKRV